MDFLKRDIAPLTAKIWEELDERAKEILKSNLKLRKIVDVEGPFGWQYSSYNLGTNELVESSADSLGWGLRKSLPLIEVRNPFTLKLWTLDDIERGNIAPNLEPLETAAKEIAKFENNIILRGLEKANITGLYTLAKSNSIKSSQNNVGDFIVSLHNVKKRFIENGIEGPYSLVINKEVWERLYSQQLSYPLNLLVNEVLNAKIELIHDLEQSFVVSTRGKDFKLILGQDLSLGYLTHVDEEVKLFFTETFTFYAVTPEAIVGLEF